MVNSGPLYLAYILCVGFFILFCVFLCGFLFFVTKLPSIRELHLQCCGFPSGMASHIFSIALCPLVTHTHKKPTPKNKFKVSDICKVLEFSQKYQAT